jgi:predicted outer membrane repeat protein
MRRFLVGLSILMFASAACQGSAPATSSPIEPLPATTVAPVTSAPLSTATETPLPVDTATPTLAPGVIHVDTLEQEAYPFVANGKCSLGEAIFAANAGAPQDTCPAGGGQTLKGTTIELMPGEYHFSQRDQTPPQVEWFVSVVDVGDALPPVLFPLTIHGNGAVLVRDQSAEPFRFFEVMVNSKLDLENITLQGGDVGEDWGGAIYAMSALIDLKNVRFFDNRAENGGVLYFDLSALNVENSEFRGNHATGSGGALYISSSKATIQSTRFEANTSDGNGGGLYADFVTLLMQDAFFLQNRVTGEQYGSRGGGMYLNHVNLTVTDSQFYQNEAPMYGGAISVNNPQLAGIDPEDGDPIEQLQESPMIADMMTSIPGFQATLEAHPSGIYVDFQEDAQIHNNCFANNVTINPQDPNWTSGLVGRASVADGNYWGHASGPSGMGPGTGDSVGKRLVFEPFLTTVPDFCDADLAQQE